MNLHDEPDPTVIVILANKFWSEKLNGFIRPACNQCNTYLPKESLKENPRDPN